MPDGDDPPADRPSGSANDVSQTAGPGPSNPPNGAALRVLILADGCNPEFVSIPLEGWSHFAAISRRVQTHLITQVRNAGALERAGLRRDVDFTAIDTERFQRPAYALAGLLRGGRGKGWTTLAAINSMIYSQFERLAWRAIGPRVRAGEFDLVHRITPLSPVGFSVVARKCRRVGVPFVIGPLNGGVPWPKEFDAARRQEREWLSYLRFLGHWVPGVHALRRNASALIIGSRDVWGQMSPGLYRKMVYIPENAIDPARFPAPAERTFPADRPLRVAFVGRLVPYKGADMLLEAAADLIRDGRLHLTIAGKGPQLDALRQRAAELNLTAGLDLPGWVDHRAVAALLADADVFGFPSVREFGGAVALEAMAVGTVPMVVDYAGPAELVTPGTGYLVPLGTREQVIDRYRTLLTELVADRSPLVAKSRLAVRRAREQFTWDAKAEQTVAVYRWVLGRGDKPAFPMPVPEPT